MAEDLKRAINRGERGAVWDVVIGTVPLEGVRGRSTFGSVWCARHSADSTTPPAQLYPCGRSTATSRDRPRIDGYHSIVGTVPRRGVRCEDHKATATSLHVHDSLRAPPFPYE